jgi:cytochrome b
MRKKLVYDLPTRIFHWLFAALFLGAFIIGKTIDEDSATYPFHMLIGLTLGFLVLLRLIWGVFGSRHAQFKNWALKPLDLITYFKGIVSGDKRKWAGHNPASSWAAIIMMLLGLGLVATGYLMTSSGDALKIKDWHELLANSFLVVVLMHVAGIAIHTFRHRELIGLSMLNGKKNNIDEKEQIETARAAFGVLLLAMIFAFCLNLYRNYNFQSRTLNFWGTQLQLSEQEGGEGEQNFESVEGD